MYYIAKKIYIKIGLIDFIVDIICNHFNLCKKIYTLNTFEKLHKAVNVLNACNLICIDTTHLLN